MNLRTFRIGATANGLNERNGVAVDETGDQFVVIDDVDGLLCRPQARQGSKTHLALSGNRPGRETVPTNGHDASIARGKSR